MDQGSFLNETSYGNLPEEVSNDNEEEEEEEDIHVCGVCKFQFSRIDDFVRHKKNKECSRKKIRKDFFLPERSILDALSQHQQQQQENSEERNAEEAAVISLLANQLSSQKPPLLPFQQQSQQQHSEEAATERSKRQGWDKEEDEHMLPDFTEDYFENISSKEEKSVLDSSSAKKKGSKSKKNPKVYVATTIKKDVTSGQLQTLVKLEAKKTSVFPCSMDGCSFSASYSKDLIRHIRKHTGEKPFSCSYCQKTFSRQDKMRNHERIHIGIKPFQCDMCSYKCSESGSLKKHVRVHTDERPYQCQICTYRAKDPSQLTVHLRTHTGDCPFVCTFEACSSSFKTKSDLTRHIRTHTGEKPYKCQLCNYKCAIKSNLRNHIHVNHKDSEIFKCKACDFKCANRSELKTHEQNHSANLFRCSSCDFSSTSKPSLTSHARKMHSSEAHKGHHRCSYCDFSCHWEGALSAHINKKHARKNKQGKTSRKLWLNKSACPPNFHCEFCEASFVRKDSWLSHTKQHKETMTKEVHDSDGAFQQQQQHLRYLNTDPVMTSAIQQQDTTLNQLSSSPSKPIQFLTSFSLGEQLVLPFKLHDSSLVVPATEQLVLHEDGALANVATQAVSNAAAVGQIQYVLTNHQSQILTAVGKGDNFAGLQQPQAVILQPNGHTIPIHFSNK